MGAIVDPSGSLFRKGETALSGIVPLIRGDPAVRKLRADHQEVREMAQKGNSDKVLNLSYFSPKIEKRTSGIEGRGLYARSSIRKGEIAVVKGGYILTKAQRDEIGKELGPSEIQVSEDLFIGPSTIAEREGGMMHLNHSCEPNLGIQGQIVYVALRDIDPGEELTFDYAMTDDEPCEMKCRCGAKSCRGTITGFDWKRSEVQKKYDGYFSWFIQRRIDAAKTRPS